MVSYLLGCEGIAESGDRTTVGYVFEEETFEFFEVWFFTSHCWGSAI